MASLWKRGGLTWKQLGYRVWCKVYDGDIFTRAAALSYYFLLALFPLLLFLITMLGYFAEAGTELRSNLLAYLGRVMPRSASELIYRTVTEITQNRDGSKLSLGLLAALWVASSGMGAISETLNVAYGVKESRPWWRARLAAVLLTIALAVLIITALALVLYGGEIGAGLATRLGLGSAFTAAWTILQWPIVLAFVLLAFALIYYFASQSRRSKVVLGHARLGARCRAVATGLFRLSPLPALFRHLQRRHLWLARGSDHSHAMVLSDRCGHPDRR